MTRLALVLLLSLLLGTLSVVAQSDAEVKVYVTDTGQKYHKASCRHLKQSKREVTLQWAKEHNYTPCKVCKPPT